MQEIQGAEHSKQYGNGVLFIKPRVILLQYISEIAADIIRHDEYVAHVSACDNIFNFDRMDIFLHFSQLS